MGFRDPHLKVSRGSGLHHSGARSRRPRKARQCSGTTAKKQRCRRQIPYDLSTPESRRRWQTGRCGRCKGGPDIYSETYRDTANEAVVRDALQSSQWPQDATHAFGRDSTLNILMDVLIDKLREDEVTHQSRHSRSIGAHDALAFPLHLDLDDCQAIFDLAPLGDPRSADAHLRMLDEFYVSPRVTKDWGRGKSETALEALAATTESMDVLARIAEYEAHSYGTSFYAPVVNRISELCAEHQRNGTTDSDEYAFMQEMLLGIADTALNQIGADPNDNYYDEFDTDSFDALYSTADDKTALVNAIAHNYGAQRHLMARSLREWLLALGEDCPRFVVEASVWDPETTDLATQHCKADDDILAAAEIVRGGTDRPVSYSTARQCSRYRLEHSMSREYVRCQKMFKNGKDIDWCGLCQGAPATHAADKQETLPAEYVPSPDSKREALRWAFRDKFIRPPEMDEWREALTSIKAAPGVSAPTEPEALNSMWKALSAGVLPASGYGGFNVAGFATVVDDANGKSRSALLRIDGYTALAAFPEGYCHGFDDSIELPANLTEDLDDGRAELRGCYNANGKVCLDLHNSNDPDIVDAEKIAARHYTDARSVGPRKFSALPTVLRKPFRHLGLDLSDISLKHPQRGAVLRISRDEICGLIDSARDFSDQNPEMNLPTLRICVPVDGSRPEIAVDIGAADPPEPATLPQWQAEPDSYEYGSPADITPEETTVWLGLDRLEGILNATEQLGSEDIAIGVSLFADDESSRRNALVALELGGGILGLQMALA